MKKWFKILKGEVPSKSDEIRSEIEDLKEQLGFKKNEIARLTKDLKKARMEHLAGAENGETVFSLEEQKSEYEKEVCVIEEALFDLAALLSETEVDENLKEIYSIEKEVQDALKEKRELSEKFLKVAGEAAGLWILLMPGGDPFRAGRAHNPVLSADVIDVKESRNIYRESMYKSLDNNSHIQESISELRRKRASLIKGLPVDVRREHGFKVAINHR